MHESAACLTRDAGAWALIVGKTLATSRFVVLSDSMSRVAGAKFTQCLYDGIMRRVTINQQEECFVLGDAVQACALFLHAYSCLGMSGQSPMKKISPALLQPQMAQCISSRPLLKSTCTRLCVSPFFIAELCLFIMLRCLRMRTALDTAA